MKFQENSGNFTRNHGGNLRNFLSLEKHERLEKYEKREKGMRKVGEICEYVFFVKQFVKLVSDLFVRINNIYLHENS